MATSYELIDETSGISYTHLRWRILFLVCICAFSTFLVYQAWEFVYSPFHNGVHRYPHSTPAVPAIWSQRASLYSLAYQEQSGESHDFRLVKNSTFRIKYLHSDEDNEYISSNGELNPAPNKTLLICYYCTPDSKDGYVDMNLTDVNGTLCTHINVGMAQIINSTIVLSTDLKNVLLYDISKLRSKHPTVKFLLWIGGGGLASDGFPKMVKNHENRKLFIQSLKSILSTYKLDGCDLDWEFPSAYNRERMHFSQLLYEIRQEYKRERRNYLLSLAVAAPEGISVFSYDVGEINKYADHVNIMTYDFHFYTKGTPFTGINAPLYRRENEHSILSTLNINYSVNWWIANGLERKKVIVGLPTYGHSFSLVNPFNTKIGAPAFGYGYSGNQGFVTASEVCWFLEQNVLSTFEFDKETCSPYASSGTEWISFENTASMKCKSEYIRKLGLGGAMIFSLNTDDFRGICTANKTFPLLQTVYDTLKL
ncbi:chitinase-3-like protein [Musca autumnalis]|uniref:chitinase-3-like protein n=1 Tax=Musca autumnalis TaxID=221902 RepID=UPI003CF129B9